VHLR